MRFKRGPKFLLGNFYFVVAEKYFSTTRIRVLYICCGQMLFLGVLNVRLNLYFTCVLRDFKTFLRRAISEFRFGLVLKYSYVYPAFCVSVKDVVLNCSVLSALGCFVDPFRWQIGLCAAIFFKRNHAGYLSKSSQFLGLLENPSGSTAILVLSRVHWQIVQYVERLQDERTLWWCYYYCIFHTRVVLMQSVLLNGDRGVVQNNEVCGRYMKWVDVRLSQGHKHI